MKLVNLSKLSKVAQLPRICLTLVMLLAANVSNVAHAGVSFTGTVVSDYLFRGVSQTDNSPAIQLSVDYEHQSGLFAGVWGSNVDFNDAADAEIDFLIGYAGDINSSVSFDLSYVYYTYTGYSSSEEIDYSEIIANGYFNDFTFTYGFAPDYAQTDDASHYISAAYAYGLPEEISLTMQLGYSFGDAFDKAEYIDYSVIASKEIQGVEISVGLTNTDLDDNDNADLRFVVGVSYSL